MYTREHIKRELYAKYIRPTKRAKKNYIGIEIEMPVVALDGTATDYQTAQQAFAKAVEYFGFQPEHYDENGVCYSAVNQENGDIFSFDCSYNNLEFSMGKEQKLSELARRFGEYVTFFNRELERNGHLLTGMGVNPNYQVNRKDFIPATRYKMLEYYLKKSREWKIPMYFHPYPEYASYASASQVQLDVEEDELISVLRAFSLLEPVKAVLFSNSVMQSEPELLCVRDLFWENSTHGINPHNIGMFDCELTCVDDLLEYIATTSIFCAEREGHYLFFQPIPITDYLEQDTMVGEYRENGRFYKMEFKPELSDLRYLRTYKFEDLTFRGTIEFRSVCSQPLSEAMTVAAFHVGLMEKVPELLDLLEGDHVLYHHGYSATELRKLMNHRTWPEFIDRNGLKKLCCDVLRLAEQGLRARGFGEEGYLVPLFHRATTLCSPGRKFAEAMEAGASMQQQIRSYSYHGSVTQGILPIDRKKISSLTFCGNFGLEKESLRITKDGRFAHTKHPFAGSKHIVMDFCENQTEINTGVSSDAHAAVKELEKHTTQVYQTINELGEYLWPFSNPPYIENERDIPIAQFKGAETSKTRYREYLADRYGRYKMSLCGIHVNYSFSDELLQAAFEVSGKVDFRTYKDELYLTLAQRLAAYGWIVTVLTAASPVMDSSYIEKGSAGGGTFLGMASVRCSELGYWNHFSPIFDYSSLNGYVDSIEQYVTNGLISFPSELYYPIRLKPKGMNSLDSLRENGIDHIELRMVDLNPMTYAGIDERDLEFIQLLLIWLAATPTEEFSAKAQVQAVQNFKNAAHYDLKTVNIVTPDGEVSSVVEAGLRMLQLMKEFYRGYSAEIDAVLSFEERKLTEPETRYAWQIRQKYGDAFMRNGLEIAKERQKQSWSHAKCM